MQDQLYKKLMKSQRYKDFRVSMWHSKPQICYLCGYRINANTPYNELSFELDHIIPASIYPDGIFEEENVMLTHKVCNQKKGDRQLNPNLQKLCQAEIEKLAKKLSINLSGNSDYMVNDEINDNQFNSDFTELPIDDSGLFV